MQSNIFFVNKPILFYVPIVFIDFVCDQYPKRPYVVDVEESSNIALFLSAADRYRSSFTTDILKRIQLYLEANQWFECWFHGHSISKHSGPQDDQRSESSLSSIVSTFFKENHDKIPAHCT